MIYDSSTLGQAGPAYSAFVDDCDSYLKVLADSPYGAALNAVAYGVNDLQTTLDRAHERLAITRKVTDRLIQRAKEWDETIGSMEASQVATSIVAEQYTCMGAAELLGDRLPNTSKLFADTANLLESGRTDLIQGFVGNTSAEVAFSASVDGLLSRVLDGTPAAMAFGAANTLAKALSGKDISQLMTQQLASAMGEMAAAVPVVGMAISLVTSIMDYTNAIGNEQRRLCIAAANSVFKGEMDRLSEIQSKRISFGDASLPRVYVYTGGQAGLFGRFEGSAFLRMTTGRILRSAVLCHLYTKEHKVEDFASLNGDAGAAGVLAVGAVLRAGFKGEFAATRSDIAARMNELGYSMRFTGHGATLGGALDGERTVAGALISAAKDLWKRNLLRYDELFVLAHHYSRGGWDAGSKEEVRWDNRPTDFGPVIIPDPYEPAETCDDQEPAYSVLRSHALASIVMSLISRP